MIIIIDMCVEYRDDRHSRSSDSPSRMSSKINDVTERFLQNK